MEAEFNQKDVIVMKLLHYFMVCANYKPVILHGAQNEIWLENMNMDYKIVRIVSNYIHNDEQLDFDIFKTKKITSSIKRKTLNFNIDVLSIYVDINDSVDFSKHAEKHISLVKANEESDLKDYDFLNDYYPDILNKLKFDEEGVSLFLKITDDIDKKNKEEAEKVDDIFKPKFPYVTVILIAINIFVFLYGFLLNKGDYLINVFSTYGPYIRDGEYYRLITGAFVHVDLLHILCNMYALWVVGSQAEGFFGKTKYLIIYLFSALTSSMLSIMFNLNTASIGASGAIFGVLGSLLYFGYYYRVYLGNNMIRQILPVILLNLIIGFMASGIDNFAHIGGLVGGVLITSALGLKYKTDKQGRINGIILSLIYLGFLIFMNFFYIK